MIFVARAACWRHRMLLAREKLPRQNTCVKYGRQVNLQLRQLLFCPGHTCYMSNMPYIRARPCGMCRDTVPGPCSTPNVFSALNGWSCVGGTVPENAKFTPTTSPPMFRSRTLRKVPQDVYTLRIPTAVLVTQSRWLQPPHHECGWLDTYMYHARGEDTLADLPADPGSNSHSPVLARQRLPCSASATCDPMCALPQPCHGHTAKATWTNGQAAYLPATRRLAHSLLTHCRRTCMSQVAQLQHRHATRGQATGPAVAKSSPLLVLGRAPGCLSVGVLQLSSLVRHIRVDTYTYRDQHLDH